MAFGFDEVRRIRFDFDADTTGVDRGMGSMTGSMTRAGAASELLTGALRRAGTMALDVGIQAAKGAAQWAFDGIAMAETAIVIGESFDTTFGPAAVGLMEDMDRLRLSMGLSEAEFQKQAVTLGQVATATGSTREEAAAMAALLITASGDVAAFNGDISQANEVLTAMQAAIRGEFDPLERFGVAIKQADVNARALADSTKTSTAELTTQEKQAATLALIMEALGDETGSLEDAMGSAAEQQNVLNAELEDAQTELGEALIPVKALAIEIALKLVPALNAVIGEFRNKLVLLGHIGTALGNVAGHISVLGGKVINVTSHLRGLGGVLSDVANKAINMGNKIASAVSRIPGTAALSRLGRLFSFHSGGTVPGPIGVETLAMVQGGEKISGARGGRAAGQGDGDGGTVINVTIQAGVGDPMAIGRELVDVLSEYTRQTGPADISVRQTA